MDEYDRLLWSAVDQGDVASMETCLSSMSDPNVYLNRIYEVRQDRCTLLMRACLKGQENIVHMLLSSFKPDLEVLNTITIMNRNDTFVTYDDITVLCAAVVINYFLMVEELIEHGARINHTTRDKSTPIRYACYNGNHVMVRYLVENGADIRMNIDNQETNLALSVRHGYFQVTAYLVDELGCDVNECGNTGRSLLYSAVECKSLELVRFLLDYGLRNFPSTNDLMSPLMLAAETRCSEIVEEISIYCSLLEWIEAEELLGSAFACIEYGPCDLRQSYEHYYRALQLRSLHNLPKVLKQSTNEIFNDRQECQTIDQLEELRLNHEDMYIEALLIRERLLGPTSDKYHASLIYRGIGLMHNAQFHQTLAFWLYELRLCQQYSLMIDPEYLRLFTLLFSEMSLASMTVSIDTILTIISAVIGEIKYNQEEIDYHLYTLLFLITAISQVLRIGERYRFFTSNFSLALNRGTRL